MKRSLSILPLMITTMAIISPGYAAPAPPAQATLTGVANAPAVVPGRRRALLVAVADYDKPYKSRRDTTHWPALHTYLDTENMARTLVEKWQFRPEDILILQDLQTLTGTQVLQHPELLRAGQNGPGTGATRDGILAAFQHYLIDPARPGDVVLFMFSGHGQLIPDREGTRLKPDGLDPSMVPYDYISASAQDQKERNISGYDMQQLLQALTRKMRGPNAKVEGNITLVIDSCHSNTISRGNQITKGRGWDESLDGPKPKPRQALNAISADAKGAISTGEKGAISTGEKGRSGVPGEGQSNPLGSGYVFARNLAQGYVMFTACQSQESAYEVDDGQDHPQGGALVYNFCKALREAEPAAPPTSRDVFERLKVDIKAARPNQTPALEGEIDQQMFSGLIKPAPAYPLAQSYENGIVTLGVGQIHGVTEKSRYVLYPAGSDPANPAIQPLTEITIDHVDAFHSSALLPPTVAARFTAVQLRGAKAVLKAQYFGPLKLRVYLAGTERLATALRDPNVPAEEDAIALVPGPTSPATSDANSVTRTVATSHYDVRIARESLGGTALLTVRRDDNTLLGATTDDASTGVKLRAILLGAWRWRYLLSLNTSQGASGFEVALHVVPVKVAQANGQTTVLGDLPAAGLSGGNRVLQGGDYFQLEIENKGSATAWVTVLDLQPDGSIAPIFPNPRAAQVIENRVPGHTTLRTPTYIVQKPFGTDVFKVIVTPESVDFTPLLYQAEALPLVSRNAQQQSAEAHLPKGAVNPLARLLLSASTGQRGAGLANDVVQPESWGTAAVTLESRAP